MNTQHTEVALLERVLVPLLDGKVALDFLWKAAPNVLQTMVDEVQSAATTQADRMLERIAKVRDQVERAHNLADLQRMSDTVLSPTLLMDPSSRLWEEWDRPDLRQKVMQATEAMRELETLLNRVSQGTLQYHKLYGQLRRLEGEFFNLMRDVFAQWLRDKEEDVLRQKRENSQITWHTQTRLQIPLIAGEKVIDYVDAEITVTAETPQAFLVHNFAIVLLPRDVSPIHALRRLHLIRHFLPQDTDIIVITQRADYLDILKQHNLYTYVLEDGGGD